MQINLTNLRRRRATPPLAAAPVATVSADVRDFIAHLKRRNCSPKTIRSYALELSRVERQVGKPLSLATFPELDGYLSWLAARDVKASTVNKSLVILKSWSKWALRVDRIEKDPTLKLDKASEEKRLPKRPTDDHLRLILGDLTTDTPRQRRDNAMIACAFYLGARASEVLGLTVEAVADRPARVRLYGKGRKERVVPLTETLAEVLALWLEAHPTGAGPLFVDLRGHRFGAPLSYDGFRHVFDARCERAGLGQAGYTIHKMRHAFATMLLRRGVPLDRIQKLLGHASVQTTQIYAATELGADIDQQVGEALSL